KLVLEGLRREPASRVTSALEYATRLEQIVGLVNPREIGGWVRAAARDQLAARARRVADVESVATQPTGAPVGTTIPPRTEPRRSRRMRAGRLVAALGTLAAAVAGIWLSRAPLALGVATPDLGAQSAAASSEPGAA